MHLWDVPCDPITAYFTKARELYPDRSVLPRKEATARFQVLNDAQAQGTEMAEMAFYGFAQ